jgi:hypothetical protein
MDSIHRKKLIESILKNKLKNRRLKLDRTDLLSFPIMECWDRILTNYCIFER